MTQRYVVGFMIDHEREHVALIRKNRPAVVFAPKRATITRPPVSRSSLLFGKSNFCAAPMNNASPWSAKQKWR